jgi:uncharacterized repeat protein (TIGR02543 family)
MVRNVTDAVVLLNAIYGYDPNDPETEGILKVGLAGFDFTECLKPGFLQGKRTGVLRVPGATAAARAPFDAALQALTAAGATLVYQTNGAVLPALPNPTAPSNTNFNFKVCLPAYLATLDPNYKWYNKTLDDVYEFMNAEFIANPGTFRDQLGANLDIYRIRDCSNYVLDAETIATWAANRSSDLRQCRDEGIDRRLLEYNLDCLVGSGNMTNITARAGYPHVTIPIFRTNGTQLTGGSHMYFAGTAFSEPVLLAAAYAAEQATKARDSSTPGLADKAVLANTITVARALTSEDIAKFQITYNAAVAAYTNDFATQMDIDRADDALRSAMANKYTVTFLDWDGKVLATQIVEEGYPATAPQNPVREGYIFIGWDNDFTNVNGNITVTAQYEKEDVFGCNAVNYYYIVLALFGALPLILRTKK